MNKGDLYVTPAHQERLILGNTPSGEVAFATRGGNTQLDYDRCQLQQPAAFQSTATFSTAVSPTELARVESKFANYISANSIS